MPLAREFDKRAAKRGAAEAAFALAAPDDAAELTQTENTGNVKAGASRARLWYEKAAA